jgi:peroxin-19
MASSAKENAQVESAPDPDEDDLDDLDDVLDEFEAKPKLPSEPKPADKPTTSKTADASGPGRPKLPETEDDAIEDDEDLSKHLQAGMDSLINELGSNPEMQKQFEDMMAELIAAGAAPTQDQAAEHVKRASENMPEIPDESVKKGASSSKKEDSFQDTIRKTMERMQASDTTAKTATASGAEKSEDEMFAEMLKQLGAGGEGGMGGEEDFNSMLLSMMSQLTNKEILYDPMKELHEKFPAWMEAHQESEKADDLQRYREQQRLVGEIVARFERSGYSDDNEQDREYIVERMQKVRSNI